jgi:hypothetical protein
LLDGKCLFLETRSKITHFKTDISKTAAEEKAAAEAKASAEDGALSTKIKEQKNEIGKLKLRLETGRGLIHSGH